MLKIKTKYAGLEALVLTSGNMTNVLILQLNVIIRGGFGEDTKAEGVVVLDATYQPMTRG
jgi:hypothetical protein